MNNFIGHIEARIDAKGRLLFPAAFKRQLSHDAQETFILKKDIYEQCLILYPHDSWEKIVKQLQEKLNPYNRQHNLFLRKFFTETAELSLDANNRILLPKRLTDLVGIDRDVLLIGVGDKIEIWNPEIFQKQLLSDQEFTQLAQDILGNVSLNDS